MDSPTMSVTYRPFVDDDFGEMASLVARTWYNYLPRKLSRMCSELDLCMSLVKHTYCLVAERDGHVAGFVIAGIKGQMPYAEKWQAEFDRLTAQLLDEDRDEVERTRHERYISRAEESFTQVFEDSDDPRADGRELLITTDPRARGFGIGKRLFEAAVEHIKEAGARGFFLVTDEECDFTFYDHLGLERIATMDVPYDGDSYVMLIFAQRF